MIHITERVPGWKPATPAFLQGARVPQALRISCDPPSWAQLLGTNRVGKVREPKQFPADHLWPKAQLKGKKFTQGHSRPPVQQAGCICRVQKGVPANLVWRTPTRSMVTMAITYDDPDQVQQWSPWAHEQKCTRKLPIFLVPGEPTTRPLHIHTRGENTDEMQFLYFLPKYSHFCLNQLQTAPDFKTSMSKPVPTNQNKCVWAPGAGGSKSGRLPEGGEKRILVAG